jgi:hypothetical protein
MLRQGRILGRERTIHHVVDFEHRRRANQVSHARWIVHTRQFHQNFVVRAGLPVLLHGLLSQTELVYTVADRVDRALHRIGLQFDQVGRLQPQHVVGGIGGGCNIGRIALAQHAAEGARLQGRHTLDGNLHRIGLSHRLRIVAVHAGPSEVLLFHVLLEPLHGLVGVGLHGVLHLNLQHQVAAALQIQPEPDIVLEIPYQVGLRPGEIDDAIDAQQNRHHNNHGTSFHICLHGVVSLLN